MAISRSVTQAPSFIDDLAKDYGTQLTGLTAVPLDTSRFAPQVAAQDALQTQAATLAGQGVGSYQPFLQQAQTTLAGAQGMLGSGAGTGAGTISDFMSPYQSSVIDTTLAEFDRNRAIQEQRIRDQQAQLGVLGAGRAGVQLAEFQTGSDRDRAALQAQLLSSGFGIRAVPDFDYCHAHTNNPIDDRCRVFTIGGLFNDFPGFSSCLSE